MIYDAVKDLSAEATADLFIRTFIQYHGIPSAVTSDRGTQWVNAFWKRVCERVGINQHLSTTYHPETDGSTERANQELEHYIRCFATYRQENWDELLPIAELCANSHASSSTGFSPFFLQHGYNLDPIPLNSMEQTPTSERSPQAKAEMLVMKLRDAQAMAQAAIATAQ